MSRISTLSTNQTLIQYMMNSQERLLDYNTQLGTNKVSQTYGGIASQSSLLVTMETNVISMESYVEANNLEEIRLSISGSVVAGLDNTLDDFLQILKDNQSAERTEENIANIQDWAFRTLADIETYLNSEADGRYMFGGSNVSTPPVNLGLSTLSAFQSTYDGYNTTYPTTRDAHLTNLSLTQDDNNTDTSAFINAANWLTFYQDNDNDQFSSGSSTIEAPSAMFSNLSAGSVINVSGTTGGTNDGSYTISSVTSTTVTINTTMLTDESAIAQFTDETLTDPHGATVTTGDGTAYATGATGDLTFDRAASTLTAATAGAFSAISVGDHIQVSGSASNNGTYEVTGVAGDVLTLATNTSVTVTLPDNTVLNNTNTGDVTFDRSASTITAATANAFSGVSVGDIITVAGSGQNNGTYTVSANTGTVLTLETNSLTDQGVNSGTTFSNYPVGSQLVFDATNETITVQDYAGTAIANIFDDYQVGDSITVANTTVSPTLLTQTVFTSVGLNQDTIQIQDGGGTAVAGAFNGVRVGDTITLAGSTAGANDQTYTVNFVSADGSTITVDGNIGAAATDTASIAVSGASITNFTTQMDLQFTDNGATDRITLQDDTAAGVAGAFDNMTAGMTVTIANSTSNDGTYLITNVDSAGGFIDVTAVGGGDPGLTTETSVAATTITGSGNDGTYTISSISSDGSQVTLNSSTPLIADQTDVDSATVSSSARGLSFTSASRVLIDDSAETLQIVDARTGSALTDAVQGLAAGMMFEINGSGANDGFYKIASVNSTTATITFDSTTPITGGDENYMPSSAAGGTSNLRVYGTPGTLGSSTDYYEGDEILSQHRLEEGRTIDTLYTAIDPAFEKAIRAASILAQGEFGTQGGLDQNWDRMEDAIYLLEETVGIDHTSAPPFGTEQFGDTQFILQSIAFDQLVISQTNTRLASTINSFTDSVSEIEDINQTEVIVQLLTQERAVQASYEAIARVQTLALTNYL